jgi:PAS domain S-box-containing protein
MKTSPPPATLRTLRAENAELRARLAEAEDTLLAIRAGDVDALVVEGDDGPQIFTLQGLDAEQNRSRGEMLAQVSDSVIAVDNEEHITFLNAAAERQYGIRADEVVGRKLNSVITRHWPSPEAEAEMWTAMGERGEWHGEMIHRTHDGRELHIESSAAALRGPDGERIGVVRTIRDVSGRKQLELEKAEALRLLDTLLTHAPVGFVFLDLDLRFVRINDRLAEINGLTIAAHLGKTVAEILPTLEATLREVTARILATGQPVLDHEFSGETARMPGITRYWNQSWYPVHDERGEIIGFGGVVDEITERKRAEEALRHNERRFRGIFDSAFQFIGLMSPDGTLLEANRTALEAGGLQAENVIGKPFWECDWWTLTERTGRELRAAIGRAASGELVRYDVDVRGAEGQVVTIDFTIKPIRDEAGRVVLLIPEGRDITCLKQAEENLRLTNQRFDLAVKCSRVVLWQQDLELRFTWLHNPVPGIEGSNAVGKRDEDLLERTEDVAVIVALKREVIRRGVGLQREFSPQIQGEVRSFEVLMEPCRDAAGLITGITGAAIDITAHKRAEEALRAREQFNQVVLDSIPAHVAVLNAKGAVLAVNAPWRTFAEENGLRPECCGPGTNYLEVCRSAATRGDTDAAAVAQGIEAVLNGHEAGFSVEYACHSPDEQRWFVMQAQRALEPLEGAIVSHWSITERKRAEAAQQRSEAHLRYALRAAAAGAWDWDIRSEKILWSPENYLLYDLDPAQGPPRYADWECRVHPEDRDRANEHVSAALEGREQEFRTEFRVITRQGAVRWLQGLGRVERDREGRPVRMSGLNLDITKRKLAEDELRESEAKLRYQLSQLALLEQITRAISSHLDFQHILKVVTHSLEDALLVDFCCVCLFDEQAKECAVAQVGLKSAPLALELAMPEHAVISLDCVALAPAARGELSYLPDVREMEFPFLQRLAQAGLRSLVVAPLALEGKVIGFLVVARREERGFLEGECEFLKQLSEHVALACQQAKLHDSLQAAYDALRRTQQAAMQRDRLRALGRMASGIAHDISNAISPVTLYAASLLEHESDLSVRARDYLQTIHQSVQNVAETIARMREFYHPDEPQVMLKPVHLNHLAQQALDLTRVRWSDGPHERGIVIQTEVRLAEDLPDIMGIESEIRDAIVNLIFNAVDAMPEGGTLTLRTVAEPITPGTGGTPDARQACLELIDTGIGMDEATRRRCLEPFFTTKGEHGSGLGLAMVDGMIARHRAQIEIESTPGQGTTARLLFPVSAVDSRGIDPPLEAKPEPANQRILFIDDDPRLLKSICDTLETDGHTVVTAAGGQEGIRAFIQAQKRQEAFTVVITDLGMPHADGRKVASAVKAASPSTPVIMLTGWGHQLEAEGNIPAQVDRLLSKPPNLRELREALAACCPPDPSKPTNA